jgi:hypothetical protein
MVVTTCPGKVMAYFNTTAPLQSDSSFQLPEKSIKAKV